MNRDFSATASQATPHGRRHANQPAVRWNRNWRPTASSSMPSSSMSLPAGLGRPASPRRGPCDASILGSRANPLAPVCARCAHARADERARAHRARPSPPRSRARDGPAAPGARPPHTHGARAARGRWHGAGGRGGRQVILGLDSGLAHRACAGARTHTRTFARAHTVYRPLASQLGLLPPLLPRSRAGPRHGSCGRIQASRRRAPASAKACRESGGGGGGGGGCGRGGQVWILGKEGLVGPSGEECFTSLLDVTVLSPSFCVHVCL